jgi:hypothetical protein
VRHLVASVPAASSIAMMMVGIVPGVDPWGGRSWWVAAKSCETVGVDPGAIVEIGVVEIGIAEPGAAEIVEVEWRRRPWA